MNRQQKTMEKVIIFDRPSDTRTGFLSNESKHSFILDEKRWPTVEHYIQAKKFDGTEYEEVIRNASTVHQARRLAQPQTKLCVGDGGKISRTKVYGRKNISSSKPTECYMREDWKTAELIFMEEAIRAKFKQNARLKKRLLDTHNASLQNPKNPLVGPILERVRQELSAQHFFPVSSGANPESNGWNPEELDDFKTDRLSAKDRKFVKNLINLALRVAEIEGWDKVHSEMIEDAVFNLAPNKKLGDKVIKYINGIHHISWTDIYTTMPNYEKIINEIHEIFMKMDPWQSHQVGPTVLIAATVRWLNTAATAEQKSSFYKHSDEWESIDIVLQKQKRWYRTTTEITPTKKKAVKSRSGPSKKIPKPKVASLISKKKSTKTTFSSQKEKTLIRQIIEKEQDRIDELTLKEIQALLKEHLGQSPTMKKEEIKEYAFNIIDELKSSEPEPEPKAPKISKSKAPTAPSKDIPPKRIEVPKNLPDKLTIHDIANGGFIVWGKPLPKYAGKLLALGGKYPTKTIGGKMVEDRSIMQFQGKSLENNIDKLKSLGGRYLTHGKGFKITQNLKIIQFQGTPLTKNRKELEELGGKYIRKRAGGHQAVDTYRIRFSGSSLHRKRVEEIIFGSLTSADKYVAAYQKWAEDKITDFIDTCIQVAHIKSTTEIDEDILKIVVTQIYGCNKMDQPESSMSSPSKTITLNYNDIIYTVLSREEYTQYRLTDTAEALLSQYVESLGSILITGIEKNTYEGFTDHLNKIGKWIDKMGECPKMKGFTSQNVCILRALRHISACFKNILGYPLSAELYIRAFLTLLPPKGWRLSAEQYITTVMEQTGGAQTEDVDTWKYEDWMAEDEIERHLRSHDITFSLSEIYEVIEHYDQEAISNGSIAGVLFEDDEKDSNRELCAIVFAAAVYYLSPDLQKPGYEHVFRRVKVLGYTPKQETVTRRKKSKITEKRNY